MSLTNKKNKLVQIIANEINITQDNLIGSYDVFNTILQFRAELGVNKQKVERYSHVTNKVNDYIDIMGYSIEQLYGINNEDTSPKDKVMHVEDKYLSSNRKAKNYLLDGNQVLYVFSDISLPLAECLANKLNDNLRVKTSLIDIANKIKTKNELIIFNDTLNEFELSKKHIKELNDIVYNNTSITLTKRPIFVDGLPISELIDRFNLNIIPSELNKLLLEAGYLSLDSIGQYIINEPHKYGYNETHETSNVSQPLWYEDKFKELIDELNISA